ncbi:hypothetical protein SNE40_015821 [Patella caerulea]|uniref:Uncharacterized protein n=1 Tax=Patella caerulea TaxID=87958 RepID=A0AAN8JPY4_PATCE
MILVFSLLPYHTRGSVPSPISTWPLAPASLGHPTGCYESITANHQPLLAYDGPMTYVSCYDTTEQIIENPLGSFTITLEVYPETESGVIMHYRGNNIPGIIVQLLKGVLYVVVKQVIMAGGSILANTWTSLALSYDSPSGKLIFLFYCSETDIQIVYLG